MNKKVNRLNRNEIRVIKISKEAIKELIWETLMEIGEEKLDIERNSDDIIFHMYFFFKFFYEIL